MSKHKGGNHQAISHPTSSPTSSQTRTIIAQQEYQGPLPPPEVLARFEETLPGLANRITTMAEGYAHDRWATNRTIRWSTVLGQCFAFVIGMTGIVGGFYLISTGHSPTGLTALLTTISGIVTSFIYGRRKPPPNAPHEPS